MDNFIVFPREAFLLGLCAGEFSQQIKYGCCSVADVINSRLALFLPESQTVERTLLDKVYSTVDGVPDAHVVPKLAKFSGKQIDWFEVGLPLGHVLGSLTRFSERVFDPEVDDVDKALDEPFTKETATYIQKLLEDPRITSYHFAHHGFDSCVKTVEKLFVTGQHEATIDSGFQSLIEIVDGVSEALMYFWISTGEILGILSDADADERAADAAQLFPRAFKIPDDSPVEDIIRIVEQAEIFLSSGEPTVTPRFVVAGTGPAIEILTKQVWPNDFKRKYPPTLSAVLHQHRDDTTEECQRFAHLALTLTRHYRNPASHELFECSPREAKFFLDGILTLHDLMIRIRDTDKS